jgi:hypothetical protein
MATWRPARPDRSKVGQWLRTNAGTWVQVTAVRRHAEHTTVHNLTVDRHHTFYVVAGTASVLVHNQNSCDLALGITKEGLESWAELNGFMHYVGPEWRQNKWDWMGPVQLAIDDQAITLRVRLDGFTGTSNVDMFVTAALNGAKFRMDGNGTELEMAWIARAVYRGDRTWESVKLYKGGAEISLGPVPDWWNLVVGSTAEANALRETWQKFLDRERWKHEHPNG